MASSDELDIAYLLAALAVEYDGLAVSEDWFTSGSSPFENSMLKLTNENGKILIDLVDKEDD